MTNEDKVALKEFLIGASVAIGITAIFLAVIYGFGIISVGDAELKSTEPVVVDTYENCDIIRWSTSQMAEYKYFLKCND